MGARLVLFAGPTNPKERASARRDAATPTHDSKTEARNSEFVYPLAGACKRDRAVAFA